MPLSAGWLCLFRLIVLTHFFTFPTMKLTVIAETNKQQLPTVRLKREFLWSSMVSPIVGVCFQTTPACETSPYSPVLYNGFQQTFSLKQIHLKLH